MGANFYLPSPGEVISQVGNAAQGVENAISTVVNAGVEAARTAIEQVGNSAENGTTTVTNAQTGQRGELTIEGGYVSAEEFQHFARGVVKALDSIRAALLSYDGEGGGGFGGGDDNGLMMLLLLGGGTLGASSTGTISPLLLMMMLGGGNIAPFGLYGIQTLAV